MGLYLPNTSHCRANVIQLNSTHVFFQKIKGSYSLKTSMVNTLSWPLRCSFNLTFQCLFPYFSTQSWQPHSPISHHSHGLSYPLPAEPVKFGSVPAMCQVYGCYAFLLEREEQRKDIPSWASISASLFILILLCTDLPCHSGFPDLTHPSPSTTKIKAV